MYTRMKRVTDPLNDKAKARIVGGLGRNDPYYISSGSEHSSQAIDDATPDIFFHFDLDEGGNNSPTSPQHSDSESDSDRERSSTMCDSSLANHEDLNTIQRVLYNQSADEYRNVLISHVSKALQVFNCSLSDREMTRRNVMSFLRNYGYNAAICKTRWKSSGGLVAGNYEFIDVLHSDNLTRYFIDLDFASEFDIARPTSTYKRLFEFLPRIFVGKGDDLKHILRIISDGARRSIKSRDLILPPWRKHRFMQNKWFGSFKRTTNLFPSTFSNKSQTAGKRGDGVRCRAVGFDAGRLLTARTR